MVRQVPSCRRLEEHVDAIARSHLARCRQERLFIEGPDLNRVTFAGSPAVRLVVVDGRRAAWFVRPV